MSFSGICLLIPAWVFGTGRHHHVSFRMSLVLKESWNASLRKVQTGFTKTGTGSPGDSGTSLSHFCVVLSGLILFVLNLLTEKSHEKKVARNSTSLWCSCQHCANKTQTLGKLCFLLLFLTCWPCFLYSKSDHTTAALSMRVFSSLSTSQHCRHSQSHVIIIAYQPFIIWIVVCLYKASCCFSSQIFL